MMVHYFVFVLLGLGMWVDNKKNGYGVYYFEKEKNKYEGQFNNNMIHGFGKLSKEN